MKTFFKYGLAIFILIIAVFFITNYFVAQKIEGLLAKESTLSYADINVNAFAGSMSLEDVIFDESTNKLEIKNINLNVDIIRYLLHKEIKIESIDAEGLDLKLKLATNSNPKPKRKKINIVGIQELNVSDAQITAENEIKTILVTENVNLYATDISWPLDEHLNWLKNKSITIDAKKLTYNLDQLHDLKSESFSYADKSITFKGFSLKPKFSKANYINQIQKQTDLMNLNTKTLAISGFDLKKEDSLYSIMAQKIDIDSTNFNIYRDKTIAPDTSLKALYSQALRDLKFRLAVDSLTVADMNLVYQELLKKNRSPGELKLNSINGQITNIHNTLNAPEPDIEAKFKAKFTKGSDIYFNWSFVPDHDYFSLSTLLQNVEDESVNNFFAPAMNMKMDGTINKIETSFSGNNTQMNGDFKIAYKKLKLNILKKDGSKNNFASLLSNVFVNNRDVDKTYQLKEVKRDQTKSFWNYVWTYHLNGLKKVLL